MPNDSMSGFDAFDAAVIADAIEVHGSTKVSPPFAIVPMQRRPVVPMPDAVKARFSDHLRALIARAFGAPPEQSSVLRDEDPHPAAIDAACCLCHGKCCLNGGPNNAFLETGDIDRFRLRNPGSTEAEALQTYAALIPEHHVLGSCVFHGQTGCTLPRSMRSDLCNTFLCSGQRQIAEGLETGARSVTMIAEFRGKASALAKTSGDDE